jgi:ATP-dependent DNA helicase PIF1
MFYFVIVDVKDILTQLKLEKTINYTAPTGVAACNVSGLTVHSWAGIGLANKPVEEIVAEVSRNRLAKKRCALSKTIISLCTSTLFP